MTEKRHIYLDNSATTPICDEALAAYIDASRNHFGNPSSLHTLGVEAERATEASRGEILGSLYAKSGDIIFTASGSEANNLAIIGRARAKERFRSGAKIITTMGEHASVNMPLEMLSREGYDIVKIPTTGGEIDLGALEHELGSDCILVAAMLVNNETGAVYNIPQVAKLIKKKAPGAYLHVDATQGYMKIPFSPEGLGADTVTVSSHKIEGPKGVGALYVSERVVKEKGLSPVIFGGGQEKGLRSGTENVPGIVAFGVAARIGHEKMKPNIQRLETLRDRLIEKIETDQVLSVISVTRPPMHAPHILNITLPDIKSETMLHYLSSEGIYVSSGSACSSNTGHISSALTAYGRSEHEADCSIRISFSPRNTEDDVDALCDALVTGLGKLARIR